MAHRFLSPGTAALALLIVTSTIGCAASPTTDQTPDDPKETHSPFFFGSNKPAAPSEPTSDDGVPNEATQDPAAFDETPAAPVALPPAGKPPVKPVAPAAPPPVRPVVPALIAVPYRGVNLSGAEFGSVVPGTENIDYMWPTTKQVDYYRSKGMNTFRIGFRWERLQPSAQGEFASAYAAKLDGLVNHATAGGAKVILNPHNFARYYGNTVGSAQVPNAAFADLWRRLATRFRGNPNVMFNLVNEPNTIGTEQWVGAANAAIAAIRAAGANNLIHVPGNGWTGAHSWTSTYYGTPNSVAMLAISDPANNVVFEVHQYLDGNSSGSSDQCVSTTIGSERLAAFISWLRTNKKKGFLGEFAGGNNPTCATALNDMLRTIHGASDVMSGWLWWGGGRWAEYPFSVEPLNGQDRPLLKLLLPYLAGL